MNIYKLLLRLYPRVWRDRYEEEFLVVLASHPFSLFEGFDVMRGALDAHLHPYLGATTLILSERIRLMLSTLRRSLLTMFCAYCSFIVAGIAFQKLTEYHDFAEAAQAHSLVGFSFDLVVIGAIAALLAVLIGGLPIVAAVVKDALARKRYGLLFLLATPLLALAVFISTTLLLEALAPLGTSTFLTLLSRGIFVAVFLGAAVASTGAVCFAVTRSNIPARLLRFAVLPSLLMTLSMLVMFVATLVWGLSLCSDVPQLFNGNEGMFGTSTSGSWLRIVLVMAIATGLAVFSLMRGCSARSALRKPAR
jgi:hypothetical protein